VRPRRRAAAAPARATARARSSIERARRDLERRARGELGLVVPAELRASARAAACAAASPGERATAVRSIASASSGPARRSAPRLRAAASAASAGSPYSLRARARARCRADRRSPRAGAPRRPTTPRRRDRGDRAFDPRRRVVDPAQLFERDREPQMVRRVGARVGRVAPGRERRDERIAVADLLVQRSELGELRVSSGSISPARRSAWRARSGSPRGRARARSRAARSRGGASGSRAEHLDLALVQVERAAPVLHRLEQPLERAQRCEVGAFASSAAA
jgi:hypothetical protein